MPGPRLVIDSFEDRPGPEASAKSSLVATSRLQITRDVSAEAEWFAGFPPADRLAALLQRNVKPLMSRMVRGVRTAGRNGA